MLLLLVLLLLLRGKAVAAMFPVNVVHQQLCLGVGEGLASFMKFICSWFFGPGTPGPGRFPGELPGSVRHQEPCLFVTSYQNTLFFEGLEPFFLILRRFAGKHVRFILVMALYLECVIFGVLGINNCAVVQVNSAPVHKSISLDDVFFAINQQAVEQKEGDLFGPRAAGALDDLPLVEQLGAAIEELGSLPALQGHLPSGYFLQALHATPPFVDEERHAPHGTEGALHLAVVRVLGPRVFQQLLELKGIFANFLHRSQKETVQRNVDHLLEKSTGLKKVNVFLLLV